jgi:hypothetical protein
MTHRMKRNELEPSARETIEFARVWINGGGQRLELYNVITRMPGVIDKETAIWSLVQAAVESYAAAFEKRHLAEVDDPDGTINMKVHNVLIAVLAPDIQLPS